jgi:hypothetical protein
MNIFCVSPALAALNSGDLDLRLQQMEALCDLIESGLIIVVYEHDYFCGFLENPAGPPVLVPASA